MRSRDRIAPSRAPSAEAAAFRKAGGRTAWKPGQGGAAQDVPGTGKGWGGGVLPKSALEDAPVPVVVDPTDSSRTLKLKLDPSRTLHRVASLPSTSTSRHAQPAPPPRQPSSTAAPAPLRQKPPHLTAATTASHSSTAAPPTSRGTMADQVRLKGPEVQPYRAHEPVASGSGHSPSSSHVYQPAPAHAVLRADLAKASNPAPASDPPRAASQPPASAWSIYKPDAPPNNVVRPIGNWAQGKSEFCTARKFSAPDPHPRGYGDSAASTASSGGGASQQHASGERKPVKWGTARAASKAGAAGLGVGMGSGSVTGAPASSTSAASQGGAAASASQGGATSSAAAASPTSGSARASKWASPAPAPGPAPSSGSTSAPQQPLAPPVPAPTPAAAAPKPAALAPPSTRPTAATAKPSLSPSPTSSSRPPAPPTASKHAPGPAPVGAAAAAPGPAPAPRTGVNSSSAAATVSAPPSSTGGASSVLPAAEWDVPEQSAEVKATLQKTGDLERQLISLQQRTTSAAAKRQELDAKSPRREQWRVKDDERKKERDARLASGGTKREKKTPEELDVLMAKMRLKNDEIRGKMEAATQDRARFEAERDARRSAEVDELARQERERVQRLSDADKEERAKKARTAELQRQIDEERARSAARKLALSSGRAWDAAKLSPSSSSTSPTTTTAAPAPATSYPSVEAAAREAERERAERARGPERAVSDDEAARIRARDGVRADEGGWETVRHQEEGGRAELVTHA
ncbi:hypothetical protein JCM3775_000253 [Rhodotorula graminis]